MRTSLSAARSTPPTSMAMPRPSPWLQPCPRQLSRSMRKATDLHPEQGLQRFDSFTITVSDGKGGTATSTVSIGVNPGQRRAQFNDPNNPNYDPVTGNYRVTTDEDKPVRQKVRAIDADGDPQLRQGNSNPTHGSVTVDVIRQLDLHPEYQHTPSNGS